MKLRSVSLLEDIISCLMAIWRLKWPSNEGLGYHNTAQNWNYSLVNRKLECQHFHWISIFVVKRVKNEAMTQWHKDSNLIFRMFLFCGMVSFSCTMMYLNEMTHLNVRGCAEAIMASLCWCLMFWLYDLYMPVKIKKWNKVRNGRRAVCVVLNRNWRIVFFG